MKIENCKVGMKVVIVIGSDKGDTGTIKNISDNAVWVHWENGESKGQTLCVSPDRIELNEETLTISEINTILDEILEDSDNISRDEWYATDYTFTKYGIDKFKEYLTEKYEKSKVKEQALAKLTPEEIEALGIKL